MRKWTKEIFIKITEIDFCDRNIDKWRLFLVMEVPETNALKAFGSFESRAAWETVLF